jgi:molybdopterin converting factor small subunit/proteasome lid subunit RPN8/RPN11
VSVTVYIPTSFRRATNNRDRVEVAANDISRLLDQLEASYGGLKGLVRDDVGEVHHHVNIYVNSEAIESLQGLHTPLKDGDEVAIIPALAGGASAIVTAEELEAIRRQAVEEYPRESCGVILEQGQLRRLVRCRNAQDELHAKDPLRYPREARTAYYIDPKDLLRIGRLEGEGYAIAVIYHSHIDAGAYFSPTDRQQALIGGEPTYPAATYLVTSVMAGRAEAVAGFRWSPSERDFVQVELDPARWRWHERLSFVAGRLWERLGIGALLGRSF